MANINMSRRADAHKKRDISVAAIVVDLAEVLKAGGEQADVLQYVALPKNAVTRGMSQIVLDPADAACTLTVDPGAGGGTIAAFNAAAAKETSVCYDFTEDNTLGLTETGKVVSVALTTLNAGVTKGRVLVLIEYFEYTKTDGELTEFVE